jgi:hypothetical protein
MASLSAVLKVAIEFKMLSRDWGAGKWITKSVQK